MKRPLIGLLAVLSLAACAGDTGPDNSLAEVAAAAYSDGGDTTITVFTMVNNSTGSGAHTAMFIDGSQRVIFDPAGSFRDPRVVERHDVLYGMSPRWVQAYKSAHARSSHHVVSQEFQVTPAQAEQALRLAQAYGSVPAAHCANSTTTILSQVDGFPPINVTFYPLKLMDQLAAIPGVKTDRYYEDDEGHVLDGLPTTLSE